MEGNIDRRHFLKRTMGAAVGVAVGQEAIAQGNEAHERVTISRLEYNCLHFGITPHQLKKLLEAGAKFDGDDISIKIDLPRRSLSLFSDDKVLRIQFGPRIIFTLANENGVRTLSFER